MLTWGIDIGGSGIKAALVDTLTGRLMTLRQEAPLAPGMSWEELLGVLARLTEEQHASPIGIAFPGVIQNGRILTTAHVNRSWFGRDLAAALAADHAGPVTVLNDADAAALAEIRLGAAKGRNGSVLVLTLGTGIGSALIRDGVLWPNTELGHLQVDGMEAEARASGRSLREKRLELSAWAAELNKVLREYHRLMWPDTIVLCGGITERAQDFVAALDVTATVLTGRFRADAGIVGAALAAAAQ
ncbi:MAG: ROK family protein [Steroidobacteraceae bacterium]